jgi:hypothetical protein
MVLRIRNQYDVDPFGMAMPLGIGSELCVFKPCADPVCGKRPGLNLIGAVPLGGIVMPLRIGIEL